MGGKGRPAWHRRYESGGTAARRKPGGFGWGSPHPGLRRAKRREASAAGARAGGVDGAVVAARAGARGTRGVGPPGRARAGAVAERLGCARLRAFDGVAAGPGTFGFGARARSGTVRLVARPRTVALGVGRCRTVVLFAARPRTVVPVVAVTALGARTIAVVCAPASLIAGVCGVGGRRRRRDDVRWGEAPHHALAFRARRRRHRRRA